MFISAKWWRSAIIASVALLSVAPAHALDKVSFITTWYAQAEHGGFYQAKATGLYKDEGLDVDLRMGGPQVNNMQLLVSGDVDMILGYDLQLLDAVHQGLPVVAVAAAYRYDLQGMMTHDDVKGLDQLGDRTILVASSAYATFWPWLKDRFGYKDAQTAPYTFNLQPFFAHDDYAQQAYPSSEPFQAKEKGVPVNFYLFADYGYPPYGGTIITTKKFLKEHPDIVKRFLHASMEGWNSYMKDPAPGNKLIRVDNDQQSDAQLAFAVEQMKKLKIIDGGEAQEKGIGTMSEARWKKTYEFMVKVDLLDKDTDWKSAFDTTIIDSMNVKPTF